MKTYTLTIEAKKQILKDNGLDTHLDRELKDCSDSIFFKIVHNMIIIK